LIRGLDTTPPPTSHRRHNKSAPRCARSSSPFRSESKLKFVGPPQTRGRRYGWASFVVRRPLWGVPAREEGDSPAVAPDGQVHTFESIHPLSFQAGVESVYSGARGGCVEGNLGGLMVGNRLMALNFFKKNAQRHRRANRESYLDRSSPKTKKNEAAAVPAALCRSTLAVLPWFD
jgi:hypothetical protein